MINAAMMSPSWKNNTSYKFILVDEKKELEQISKAIMNKDNSAAQSIIDAPMTAVVVADPECFWRSRKQRVLFSGQCHSYGAFCFISY